jgi:hypothetical protein
MMNETAAAPPSPAGRRPGSRLLTGLLKSALTEPAGLCARSALIVAVFLILHALGLRQYTTLLSGTSPDGQPITFTPLLLGALYLFFWFGTVLISPSLMIAAGLLWLIRRR